MDRSQVELQILWIESTIKTIEDRIMRLKTTKGKNDPLRNELSQYTEEETDSDIEYEISVNESWITDHQNQVQQLKIQINKDGEATKEFQTLAPRYHELDNKISALKKEPKSSENAWLLGVCYQERASVYNRLSYLDHIIRTVAAS